MPLTKAAHYRAYAAASLANAETAKDKEVREIHLAIARHFYALAENEIGRLEGRNCGPIQSELTGGSLERGRNGGKPDDQLSRAS